MTMPQLTVESPVGPLTLTEEDGAIVRVGWHAVRAQDETAVLAAAAQQLSAYFYCELDAFDLPLAPAGSDHDQRVWTAMCAIPRGETKSYGHLARSAGSVARATGVACGRNPIPVIIPCHRVTSADGGLGGYSGKGGVKTKRILLELEGWPGVAQQSLFAAE